MKRKEIWGVGAVCVITLIAVSGMAFAGDGATVVKEFGCNLIAADSGLDISLSTNEKTHSTTTPSGNTQLKCHFDIPDANLPAKTLVNSGFSCSTFLGLTTNSRSVATKGGKAHLTCTINGSN